MKGLLNNQFDSKCDFIDVGQSEKLDILGG